MSPYTRNGLERRTEMTTIMARKVVTVVAASFVLGFGSLLLLKDDPGRKAPARNSPQQRPKERRAQNIRVANSQVGRDDGHKLSADETKDVLLKVLIFYQRGQSL